MTGANAFSALSEPEARPPRQEEGFRIRFVREYQPIVFEHPAHAVGYVLVVAPHRGWLAQAFVDLGYAVRV